MSNEKDELKHLFDSAFAAEQIPFAAAGWAQMEAMLDKKGKRKAAWYWYSAAAAVLAVVALLPFLNHENETYIPRNAQPAFSEMEWESSSQKTINKGNSSYAIAENDVTPFTKQAALSDEVKSSNSKPIGTTQNGSITANYVVGNNSTANSFNRGLNLNHLADAEIAALIDPNRNIEMLGLLDARIDFDLIEDTVSNRWLGCGNSSEDNKWQRYLIAGVTKSHSTDYGMFANAGQSFGLGLTYKLKNHLYLSGELSISRDMVAFQRTNSSTHYGLSGTLIQQNILTSELIYADLPLLAQYRSNRLSIGAGPLLEYLMGLKNIETADATTVYGVPKSSQQLQNGYFSWSDYKRFGLGWQLDASYQMFETMHLGARANFGANISATTEKIRRNRFELYLKFDL